MSPQMPLARVPVETEQVTAGKHTESQAGRPGFIRTHFRGKKKTATEYRGVWGRGGAISLVESKGLWCPLVGGWIWFLQQVFISLFLLNRIFDSKNYY